MVSSMRMLMYAHKSPHPYLDEADMSKPKKIGWLIHLGLGLMLTLSETPLHAEELNPADTAWILTSTGLVLFMTVPGLALLYGGLVRTKNVLSVLIQCFAATSLVSVLWFLGGYSLSLSEGNATQAFIGGTQRLFLMGLNANSMTGHLPEAVFCLYHMTFAIFAPALMIGGIVERMKFSALLLFVGSWALLVYAPVCHWIWGGGWLAQMGALDFAGGIVVHTTGGIGTLVAATLLGARKSFPHGMTPPHNLTLTATGAGILWVGWHGFSAGSALMANGAAGMAMLNTHMAATMGALTWLFIEWIQFGKPTLLGVVTGLIAGLGVVSPAAGFIGPTGALFMGFLAGIICFYAIQWIKGIFKIDDALDVFGVHGMGGIIGSLMTAPLSLEVFGGTGLPTGLSGLQQFGIQALAVLSALLWSGAVSYVTLKLIDKSIGLRVDSDDEREGLDLSLHNSKGYHF